MREIKFRAWHNQEKHYVGTDNIVISIDGGPVLKTFAKEIYGWTSDVELEQFTGLHDKNGKEIYEGDIVEFKTIKRSKNFGFENELVHDVVNYSDYSEWLVGNSLLSRIFNDSEVIGNIHENPELLEEK